VTDTLDDRLDAIFDAVLDYEDATTERLVREELALGTDLHVILNDALIAAMDEVGDLFSQGTLFVPEMLMAARAMKAGLEVLRPLLIQTDARPAGTVVIGTVHRDLHDIGKNLVGMMLEGAGFTVINLGVDVPPDTFLEAVRTHRPDILGMSALLTTTMPNMDKTVELLRKEGWNGHIMVGGAPVTREFADAIGADGFATDAPGAVDLARRIIGAR
jgi:5-methyltetrahydrofolate--homocysteine methyltransferase